MKDRSFAIIGGDRRSYELARLLLEKEHKVNLYGFKELDVDKQIKDFDSISSALEDVDILVAPIPVSKDGIHINAPYAKGEILIEEVFRNMNKEQLFIGGKTSDYLAMKEHYEIQIVDILDREEMAVLNAIPSAEGGLQIALEEMPITLHGSNAMILGFGRIGKAMSNMLKGLGSNVYVLARKHSDISWIRMYGYNPLYIYDLKEKLKDMDLIFNTIPQMILDKGILKVIDKQTLIVDLASMPGGVNMHAAKEMDIKVIHALGLPGKVAPISSANFMLETIYNIIEEWGL
ncbi:MAG: dipicolinate synthase subunit DpsA [Tissierella sp.]|uniref:dipicolinate synthase subunit DpsA n=1 Tax=Tissierella sp. TaxID=41274 RepID=UPI003F9AB5CD